MAKEEIKQRELLRRPLQKFTSTLDVREMKLGTASTVTDTQASRESRSETGLSARVKKCHTSSLQELSDRVRLERCTAAFPRHGLARKD